MLDHTSASPPILQPRAARLREVQGLLHRRARRPARLVDGVLDLSRGRLAKLAILLVLAVRKYVGPEERDLQNLAPNVAQV